MSAKSNKTLLYRQGAGCWVGRPEQKPVNTDAKLVGAAAEACLRLDAASVTAARGQELSRSALEALALESYRLGALTQVHVGRLLGLSRIETEDFLAQHLDLYDYEPNELRRESDALSRLSDNQPR